jgi:hypothetical protein
MRKSIGIISIGKGIKYKAQAWKGYFIYTFPGRRREKNNNKMGIGRHRMPRAAPMRYGLWLGGALCCVEGYLAVLGIFDITYHSWDRKR